MSRCASWLMPRRCLVLAALLFWHGGATFYALVVIPVGLSVLDPPSHQTFVTQAVTNYLNLAGAIALVLLPWDTAAARDPSAWRRRARWLSCAVLAVALAALVWLHRYLDGLMDSERLLILDRSALRPVHRLYLSISALQWLAGMAFAFLTLSAWRAEDRQDSSAGASAH